MPKVTSSLGQASNKENVVPLSSKTKKAKASSRDEEEHDEIIRLGDVKRSKSVNTAFKQQQQHQARSGSKSSREAADSDPRQHASSSGDSIHVRRSREIEDDVDEEKDIDLQERKSSRERILEDKLALITKERDQVQSQFDELREMRQTESEKLLVEYQKAAKQRDVKAEEYINKLKSQLEIVSAKVERKEINSSSSDGAFFQRGSKVNGINGDSKKDKEEIARLQQANDSLTNALRSRTVQGAGGGNSIEDAKAIRRLYEDLTGLVISKVESAVNREKDYYRCFHAIFASDGYYNLEMKFEESESALTNNERQSTREDLVYIPTMDQDRDAEIIASGRLPSYLIEPLRFERSTAVRFLDVLHKRLDKTSKR